MSFINHIAHNQSGIIMPFLPHWPLSLFRCDQVNLQYTAVTRLHYLLLIYTSGSLPTYIPSSALESAFHLGLRALHTYPCFTYHCRKWNTQVFDFLLLERFLFIPNPQYSLMTLSLALDPASPPGLLALHTYLALCSTMTLRIFSVQ